MAKHSSRFYHCFPSILPNFFLDCFIVAIDGFSICVARIPYSHKEILRLAMISSCSLFILQPFTVDPHESTISLIFEKVESNRWMRFLAMFGIGLLSGFRDFNQCILLKSSQFNAWKSVARLSFLILQSFKGITIHSHTYRRHHTPQLLTSIKN